MILWTIQPLQIWEQIQEDGVYICDPKRISMPEFTKMYDWLADRMTEKIGPAPENVVYPVWAWYMCNGKHGKPDLRQERWHYGPGGEELVCIELEVPDEVVVLSDFELWSLVLLDALIAESEEEDTLLEKQYNSLPPAQQQEFKERNWERIFDFRPLENDWITRGKWIQATFWQLKKAYIRKARFFKTPKRKMIHKASGQTE